MLLQSQRLMANTKALLLLTQDSTWSCSHQKGLLFITITHSSYTIMSSQCPGCKAFVPMLYATMSCSTSKWVNIGRWSPPRPPYKPLLYLGYFLPLWGLFSAWSTHIYRYTPSTTIIHQDLQLRIYQNPEVWIWVTRLGHMTWNESDDFRVGLQLDKIVKDMQLDFNTSDSWLPLPFKPLTWNDFIYSPSSEFQFMIKKNCAVNHLLTTDTLNQFDSSQWRCT